MQHCPKCGSNNIKYLPWLANMWECRDCGWRGFLVFEEEGAEQRLWKLLKKIPSGKVTTYKILAEKLGLHSRTVARLLSKNKNLIKIPCHRVVFSSGKIGGYALGQAKKASLLRKEGVEVKNGKINLSKFLFKL